MGESASHQNGGARGVRACLPALCNRVRLGQRPLVPAVFRNYDWAPDARPNKKNPTSFQSFL